MGDWRTDVGSPELPAGIRSYRTLVSVYVLAGLACAIAGSGLSGRVGPISPQSFSEGRRQSITASVRGGRAHSAGAGRYLRWCRGGTLQYMGCSGLWGTEG